MSKQGKFDELFENALSRFQRTEFLVGDLVKLVDSWQKDAWAKRQTSGWLERLNQVITDGNHIRVTAIKGLFDDGMKAAGNAEGPDHHYADIVEELAPGRYTNILTVPVHLLQRVDIGNNVTAPLPDHARRDPGTHITPEDADIKKAPAGPTDPIEQTRGGHPAKENPTSNTTLPNASKPTPGESYTKSYLEM